MNVETLNSIVEKIKQGSVVAYPTEAVYGLGCDPFNIDAVTQLLQLKHRSIKKGFILIASAWEQVENLVEPIEPKALAQVFSTWPGPVTWTFPASTEVPMWVRGEQSTIAIRITDHPDAKKLCEHFGGPLISTSANLDGFPPARDIRTLRMIFQDKLDAVLTGDVGNRHKPTEIRDAISGEVLRAG